MTPSSWIKVYYILGSLFFLFYFDTTQFAIAIICHWILAGYTTSVIMHRQISHRQFEYKNKFFKYFSYFTIVISGQGTPIGWAAVHRQHHKYPDTERDPQNPKVVGRLRTFFSWYKLDNVDQQMLKDLITDKEMLFMHRYTGTLFTIWVSFVWLLFPDHALMITALIPLLCSCWVGYVNSGPGHSEENDQLKAKNLSPEMLFWGEAYHRNHHLDTSRIKMGRYDIGYYVIKLIAKKN